MQDRIITTRRGFLTGLAVSGFSISGMAMGTPEPDATLATFSWPEPVDLGDGLQILDWRFSLLSSDVYFIAELHNLNGEAVAAPTVGALLPATSSNENYAWGHPFDPVIQPGTSTFLIGQTLPNHQSNEWDAAEWMICGPTKDADKFLHQLSRIEYQVTSTTIHHRPDWLQCEVSVTNLGKEQIRNMKVSGIVRDSQGRICGGTALSNIEVLKSGETSEMTINVQPGIDMTANPLRFVNDLTGATSAFSIQPPGAALIPGCSAVMPWNR